MERTKDLKRIMQLINIELAKIENRSLEGLIRFAVHIHRETETTYPVTPRDLGNLRASWFIVTPLKVKEGSSAQFKNRPGRKGTKENLAGQMASDHSTVVAACKGTIRQLRFYAKESNQYLGLMMGYSAFYAAKVHEELGWDFQFEGSGAKWFERALKRNIKEMVVIVSKYAKVK